MARTNWKKKYETLQKAVAEYSTNDMSVSYNDKRLYDREVMFKAAGLEYSAWIVGDAPIPGGSNLYLEAIVENGKWRQRKVYKAG